MSAAKSVWITGASSGLGKALAEMFASAGWQVLATARSADSLAALAAAQPNITPLPMDLSDATADIVLPLEHLDVVIANAGTCEYMDIEALDIDLLRRVFDINVHGTMQTVKLALPCLQAGSQLVIVSSLATYLPFTRSQAYGGSKAALDYIADSLQTDLVKQGILVSLVKPGFVKTPLTDKNTFSMPFLMTAEEAAQRMFAAIQRRKRRFAFPKRMHYLLGLLSCLPKAWQHKLLAEIQV